MIPRHLTLPDEDFEEEYFCMLEQPGLEISDFGVAYDLGTEDDDIDNAE